MMLVEQLPTLTIGTVTIKSPDFGNADNVLHARIQRQNDLADLIVFRPSHWPRTKILKYKFSNLNEDDKDALFNYVHANVGKLITVTDHEDIVHSNCIITTPDLVIAQTNDCQYETSIELECYS